MCGRNSDNLPHLLRGIWESSLCEINNCETPSIGAPATFDQFKFIYGCGLPPTIFTTDEAMAIYYNAADLGIGREMHCKSFNQLGLTGKVCYVSNYYGVDAQGNAVFGGDPTRALNDAID